MTETPGRDEQDTPAVESDPSPNPPHLRSHVEGELHRVAFGPLSEEEKPPLSASFHCAYKRVRNIGITMKDTDLLYNISVLFSNIYIVVVQDRT